MSATVRWEHFSHQADFGVCGLGATLADIRSHAATNLVQLPEPLRRLQEPCDYPAHISAALHKLAEHVDKGGHKSVSTLRLFYKGQRDR